MGKDDTKQKAKILIHKSFQLYYLSLYFEFSVVGDRTKLNCGCIHETVILQLIIMACNF